MQADEGSDLVATKLTAPTLPAQLIARPRLNTVLDAAAADPAVRVVLVSAPAGSGKSTLIAGWQAARDDCAWLQAYPADRDPARFWGHLVVALAGLVPDIAEAVGPTLMSAAADAGPLLGRLVNALAGAAPATLVIDDYHVVANPAIDDAIESLIELAPPTFMLVLVTRLDPSIRLSRLRVRSQLVEVRADALNFEPTEAELLLRDADPDITTGHADALCERTEGWAAGLVLAGLSLRTSDDHDAFVQAFQGDDRLVVDYLTDEYLSQVDDADRTRMLRTAVLDQMTGPLIDAVCDRPLASEARRRVSRNRPPHRRRQPRNRRRPHRHSRHRTPQRRSDIHRARAARPARRPSRTPRQQCRHQRLAQLQHWPLRGCPSLLRRRRRA
jgi:LuxR family maltose regulon positive regulatory protein